TGTTNLFGNARSFATLEFQSSVDTRTSRTVTSDGTAQYSIRLAAGARFARARFYDGTTSYATLGLVFVAPGGTATFNPMCVNGDGTANPGEEIPGAHIDLVDDQGARLFLTTPASGDLPVPMFANRSYSGTVTAGGFGARSIPASAPAGLRALVPITLSPIPVQVSGTVLLGGSPLVNRPVTIRAVPAGDGAVAASSLSDSNGG